jgi:hypothetical protein
VSGSHAAAGLDALQRGHLRHIANLARQDPNDWAGMKGRSTGQDDFGGYRFQLAYSMIALALTHVHRLPAAPGLFKPLFLRLFEKLLLPEVWMYWRDVSRGGSIFNAHLSDRYREEWDPVRRDNIMYSAYVQACALLFHYLFRDDRYARRGAITFRHWSYFWGGEAREFAYDENTLNEHVYWLMAESGFLGVACEPNCIFQICNQPAILGFRLHDLITGGTRADDVVRAYEAAWTEFGRTSEDGHFLVMVSGDTRSPRPNKLLSPWVDAWTGALMNMWNRDFVRKHYPGQRDALVTTDPTGAKSIHVPRRPEVMGEAIVSDDCDFGWVTAWAAELGDRETLDGLLRHADHHMAPTWRDGGFYYPRNDTPEDPFGNRTLVEPHTGNVLLGYARLNIPDGLHRLYTEPLDDHFFSRPALTAVGAGVAVHRACWPDARISSFDLSAAWPGDRSVALGRISGLRGWQLYCDGSPIAAGNGAAVAPGASAMVSLREAALVIDLPDSATHRFELLQS